MLEVINAMTDGLDYMALAEAALEGMEGRWRRSLFVKEWIKKSTGESFKSLIYVRYPILIPEFIITALFLSFYLLSFQNFQDFLF